ncbi:MAG: 4Fe-4S dicluster domain-containing protein [Candidatus Omnitrophica bacterium]|nr:4Fe-4S dicluster domain-containing protein [Candidatus Omnitrophota bacterium]
MALVGKGVLQGMGLTLRTFLETYPWGRGLLRVLGRSIKDGLVTVQYPDVKQQHHERFRYFPFLVYDGAPENLRCVSCKICEQECPPQCIHIVGPAKDEQGRPLKANGRTYPVKFDIDVSICMSCRICVDVCPFDAIEMDNQYELSGMDRFDAMNFTKEKLLKSNEYFQQIKPTEAGEVDQRLAAKAAKASPKPAGAPPQNPAAPTP